MIYDDGYIRVFPKSNGIWVNSANLKNHSVMNKGEFKDPIFFTFDLVIEWSPDPFWLLISFVIEKQI